MLLVKYLSPRGAYRVLERNDKLSIRFGLPRTYNDPCELFLQPDQPLRSRQLRAFYEYFLGEIPQMPITCFAKRPDSLSMWAHYAREATGVCLIFDEEVLTDQFDIAYVNDVTYSDAPAQIPSELVYHAFTTGKRRHTIWLIAEALTAAYFTKRTSWGYELERRLVVGRNELEARDKGFLARVSPSTLRYIIVGPHTSAKLVALSKRRATQFGIPLLRLQLGARNYDPLFTSDGIGYTWTGTRFDRTSRLCQMCCEPAIDIRKGLCGWCRITDKERKSAGMRSMLTLTLHFGIDEALPISFTGLTPKGRKAGPKGPKSQM